MLLVNDSAKSFIDWPSTPPAPLEDFTCRNALTRLLLFNILSYRLYQILTISPVLRFLLPALHTNFGSSQKSCCLLAQRQCTVGASATPLNSQNQQSSFHGVPLIACLVPSNDLCPDCMVYQAPENLQINFIPSQLT